MAYAPTRIFGEFPRCAPVATDGHEIDSPRWSVICRSAFPRRSGGRVPTPTEQRGRSLLDK